MPDLLGRKAIIEAAGHHPFARLRAFGNNIRGYRSEHALIWTANRPRGLAAAGLGDPGAVIGQFRDLHAAGLLDGAMLLELPRVDIALLTPPFQLTTHEHWSVWWTTKPPSFRDGDERVVPLSADDYPAIEAVLDVAFPATGNRPGSPTIRAWYGIREGDQLVAVGADRSEHGVGYLVAITVLPDRQGRGYGAALTRRLCADRLAEFDICALGVTAANTRARALYHRLGFTEGIDLTLARLS